MATSVNFVFTFIFVLFLRIASATYEDRHLHQSVSKPHSESHHSHEAHHSHETHHSHEAHHSQHSYDHAHRAHHNSHDHHLSSPSKSKLMSLLSKSPVVLILNTESLGESNKNKLDQSSHEGIDLLRAGKILKEEPKDEDTYVIYNALRTTTENKDKLDPKTYKKLDSAKHLLRQKLSARCGQEKSCKKACKRAKKVQKCENTCEKTFDKEDVCPEDKPEEPSAECGDGNCSDDSCGDSKKCKKGKTATPEWFNFD